MIDWSMRDDMFCSVGPKHICFFDITGKKKLGSFGDVS